MSVSPPPSPTERSILLDFPASLYTAVKTLRIYPASNPQVQRSIELTIGSLQTLRHSAGKDEVTIGVSEGKLFVCAEQLPDKEQLRPQIQGLIDILGRCTTHALTFQPGFSFDDCTKLARLLASLLGQKKQSGGEPMALLLEKAGILSVSADIKKYVAIGEEEIVVRKDLLGPGGVPSTWSPVDAPGPNSSLPQGLLPELVQELIDRLPPVDAPHQHSEAVTKGVIDFLRTLSTTPESDKDDTRIEQSAKTLAGLDPNLLTRLIAALPPTPAGDALLGSTLEHLSSQQLNTLIARLISQQATAAGMPRQPLPSGGLLDRLVHLDIKRQPDIQRTITQHAEARQLLSAPETTSDQWAAHLQERITQPEWAAPILATAAQQVTDPQLLAEGQDDTAAFHRVLGQYEHLLNPEQQHFVAHQAAAQLASMEGLALGNLLAQKFKGLFGAQLYQEVVSQISHEQLDRTVEQLTPRQLNRLIATLTSDIPLSADPIGSPENKPADAGILARLARTSKGDEIAATIAHHLDARHMLHDPETTLVQLPDHLLQRLEQPEWSAKVLVAAAQQTVSPVDMSAENTASSSFARLLERYDALLEPEQQTQVAVDAAAQLTSFDEQELRRLLTRQYKGLFGEQLYRQMINQLSEIQLSNLATYFHNLAMGTAQAPQADDEAQQWAEASQRLVAAIDNEQTRGAVALRVQQLEHSRQRHRTVLLNVQHFLRGEFQDLEQEWFRQSLPATISTLLADQDSSTADQLLAQLTGAAGHESPAIRAHAFATLAATAELLAQQQHWQCLASLHSPLVAILKHAFGDEPTILRTVSALSGLAGHFLREHDFTRATEIIRGLRRLVSEEATVDLTVRRLALANLQALCSEPLLTHLIDLYLHSDSLRDAAAGLLIEMGGESARTQVQHLVDNENRHERKQLLTLIRQTGNPALPLLLEHLRDGTPWFVLRNIIRLLGEIGTPEVFAAITPYIKHPDLRVQQEVINTATKIGAEQLPDFLLHALQVADGSLHIKLLNLMGAHPDPRFVVALTDLLEGTKTIPGRTKLGLQITICKTLGEIGTKAAATTLHRVVHSQAVLSIAGYGDELRPIAKVALARINEAAKHPAATGKDAITAKEETIFRLAELGDREQAKLELVELITATARSGDFKTAERLRERIYEIDNFALGEIIRTGEIIDQEKKGAIKEEDLEIWAPLTDRLSALEFQTLYHEFSERHYLPEETIVKQGEKNEALFFISQGSVKVSHQVGNRELFITTLNRGQIVGENFFSPSFWTVTLTSLTPSRIHALQQSALNAWQEQLPGLRSKLHDYYLVSNTIRTVLEKKGLERRKDQRFSLARKIQVQPINSLDNPIGHGFRAETADISQGGLAFLIRISRHENARLLLGRRMQLVVPVGGEVQFLHLKGLVIGIQPFQLQENDFSVHIKFDRPLDQQALQAILG